MVSPLLPSKTPDSRVTARDNPNISASRLVAGGHGVTLARSSGRAQISTSSPTSSVVAECQQTLDPFRYLTDVLERLVAGHRQADIDQLLPWAYAEGV